MRILLADDHYATVRPLQLLLAAAGHQVRSADSVAAARDLIRLERFDLLVADHGLPDGDGCDLMPDAAAAGLAGIALTARAFPDDVARSRSAGFAAHLSKPIPAEVLLATIERVGAVAAAAAAVAGTAGRPGEGGN